MKEKEYRLKTLFWEATLRCNAFCEFCGSRCGEVSCNEISGEKIEKVFEDIADAYNPGSIMINVTGGEYSKSAYFSNAVGEIDEAHELIGKNVEIDVKVNQSGERMYHNVVAYRPYTQKEFISISDEELEQLPFN